MPIITGSMPLGPPGPTEGYQGRRHMSTLKCMIDFGRTKMGTSTPNSDVFSLYSDISLFRLLSLLCVSMRTGFGSETQTPTG